MTKEVEHLYDPKVRIAGMIRKESQATGKPFDQRRFDEMLKNYQMKLK